MACDSFFGVYNPTVSSTSLSINEVGSMLRFLCLIVYCMGLLPFIARAESSKPTLTRADLALALQRFERAFLDHRPEGQELINTNLVFEGVTQNFFRMNFSAAIAELNETALKLRLGRTPSNEEVWLASLKVSIDPVVVGPTSSPPIIHLREMYSRPNATRCSFDVLLLQGKVQRRFPVTPTGEKGEEIGAVTLHGEWKGTWNIHISQPNAVEFDSGRRLMVVPKDLNEWRLANKRRLDALLQPSSELSSALATCLARNELLKMDPSEANSTEFLSDPNVLAPELEEEIAAIEKKKNPYAGRVGDYWRVMNRQATKVPMRVYVPPSLNLVKPVPLVIALHGAGGDENMFMDAYGLGKLKREADRKGFIAVSPATFYFLTRSENLPAVIKELSDCYPIDHTRVYVLGHSMGGGATAKLVSEKGDLIAAACCIAGFRGFKSKEICPTLILSAELDAIVPKDMIEAEAKNAIREGLPVEYETVPSYGHTLVVEAKLSAVIDWLFMHSRDRTRSGLH